MKNWKLLLTLAVLTALIAALCGCSGNTPAAAPASEEDSGVLQGADTDLTTEPTSDGETDDDEEGSTPTDVPDDDETPLEDPSAESSQNTEPQPEAPKNAEQSSSTTAAPETNPVEAPQPATTPVEEAPPVEEPEPQPVQDPKTAAQGLIGRPVSELYAAIGNPLSTDYAPSCLVEGGEDGELVYNGFVVYTEKQGNSETVYAVM